MDAVGLDAIKQNTIFQLLSAILHLGNIKFKENGNKAFPANEKCKQSNFIIRGKLAVRQSLTYIRLPGGVFRNFRTFPLFLMPRSSSPVPLPS